MIFITKKLQLQKITPSDVDTLFTLMTEIYPPAYKDLWEDKGVWYIQEMYNKKQVLKELLETKAAYYFIVFNDKIIGNFRVLWDKNHPQLPFKKTVKLHRIYLHQKTFGQGIGVQLITWLTQQAVLKKYQILWLEAMVYKEKVIHFYSKLGFQSLSYTTLPYNLLFPDKREMIQMYKELL